MENIFGTRCSSNANRVNIGGSEEYADVAGMTLFLNKPKDLKSGNYKEGVSFGYNKSNLGGAEKREMAKEEVTLLGMWASPLAVRIEWALKFKGICYDYIDEDLSNKSQRLLTHNPVHKKIPVLLHGGKSIPESLIILEYLDETWKHNPLLPEDPYERATARFWAKFVDEKVWMSMPGIFGKIGDEQEKSTKETIENLKWLEEQLKGKKFFGGETVGYLDIVCGWIAYWVPFVEDIAGVSIVDQASFPALTAWFKTFLDVPWVKEMLPPPEKLLPHLVAFRKNVLASRS